MTSTASALAAANVRAEMARRSISQTQLAQAIGINQSGLSKRLRGLVPFDVDEMAAVAGFLDVPLAELLPQPEPEPAAS